MEGLLTLVAWHRLQSQDISADSASLICASWRKGTSKAYERAWRRWVHWCDRRKVDPCSTSIGNIANFLMGIFGEGKSHSMLNTYRSAISMSHDKVDGTSVGQHSALCRLLQGMCNARPPRPKHTTIWNVDQVIGHIRSRPPSCRCSTKRFLQSIESSLTLWCPSGRAFLVRSVIPSQGPLVTVVSRKSASSPYLLWVRLYSAIVPIYSRIPN